MFRKEEGNKAEIKESWVSWFAAYYLGIPGNEEAHAVARQATAVQGKLTAPVDKRIRELKGVI
jgi:hypothetical protein